MSDSVFELWAEGLREAYLLARGERLGELRGTRVKRFDGRGLHPESFAWGGVYRLQDVEPLLSLVVVDPLLMRQEAHREAEEIFKNELLAEVA